MNKQLQDTDPSVLRGGCWYFHEQTYVRAAYRNRHSRSIRNYVVGFRTRLPGRQPRV